MRIYRPRLLKAFWTRYADSEKALRAWYFEAKHASWSTPAELKAQYRNASILKPGRVVFNICENKYRFIVRINYRARILLIRWIGTHDEYDVIDPENV
jgi:mRNA interferase HigB